MRPTGRGPRRVLGVVLATALTASLTACTAIQEIHGYAPTDHDLSQIVVGQDNRDTVREKVGDPGASGMLESSGWYYVQSRFSTFAFRATEEVDRQVVAISFSPSGTVSNVERFGLERGQVVRLSRRTTDDTSRGTTFLRQLFSGLGRFDAGQILGGPGSQTQ